MAATFFITLREGLEAALIVGIIAAYLVRVGRHDALRSVGLGVLLALGLSVAAGVIVTLTVGRLPLVVKETLEGIAAVLAVVVLTWMLFWMRRQGRAIKGDLEGGGGGAVPRGTDPAVARVGFGAGGRGGVGDGVVARRQRIGRRQGGGDAARAPRRGGGGGGEGGGHRLRRRGDPPPAVPGGERRGAHRGRRGGRPRPPRSRRRRPGRGPRAGGRTGVGSGGPGAGGVRGGGPGRGRGTWGRSGTCWGSWASCSSTAACRSATAAPRARGHPPAYRTSPAERRFPVDVRFRTVGVVVRSAARGAAATSGVRRSPGVGRREVGGSRGRGRRRGVQVRAGDYRPTPGRSALPRGDARRGRTRGREVEEEVERGRDQRVRHGIDPRVPAGTRDRIVPLQVGRST